MYNNFTEIKTSYDTLRSTYNAKVTEEAARVNDILGVWWLTPIAIPHRPCNPARPDVYVI